MHLFVWHQARMSFEFGLELRIELCFKLVASALVSSHSVRHKCAVGRMLTWTGNESERQPVITHPSSPDHTQVGTTWLTPPTEGLSAKPWLLLRQWSGRRWWCEKYWTLFPLSATGWASWFCWGLSCSLWGTRNCQMDSLWAMWEITSKHKINVGNEAWAVLP